MPWNKGGVGTFRRFCRRKGSVIHAKPFIHLQFPVTHQSVCDLHHFTDNAARLGACRDFAHLATSFCRALNTPARYTFGYLPDMDVPPDPAPMDFAAWMEVWLGGHWWTFDPRNNTRRKGRVVIGRGRDASDVAVATTFGGPMLEAMTVDAEEWTAAREVARVR
jgi:hypothetical protein